MTDQTSPVVVAANPIMARLSLLFGILQGLDAAYGQRTLLHAGIRSGDVTNVSAPFPSAFRGRNERVTEMRAEEQMFVMGCLHLIGGLQEREAAVALCEDTPANRCPTLPAEGVSEWLAKRRDASYRDSLQGIITNAINRVSYLLRFDHERSNLDPSAVYLLDAQKRFLEALREYLKGLGNA